MKSESRTRFDLPLDHSVAQSTRTNWLGPVLRWRDAQMVRKALRVAGSPSLVLMFAYETENALKVLAEKHSRIIVAAAESYEELQTMTPHLDRISGARTFSLLSGANSIALPDNCVDCIFSEWGHDNNEPAAERLDQLEEFHRVTRESVILSSRSSELSTTVANGEFAAAGFKVQRRIDLTPLYSSRHVYVLVKTESSDA